MKIKVKDGQTGTMILNDGTQMKFGAISVTRNLSKLVFYTEKGLKEIVNPEMNETENASQLKKLDKKTLMKLGYI